MKWCKENIRNFLNRQHVKNAFKILNIAFYIITTLFIIFILGATSYEYNKMENHLYSFAKNALNVKINIKILFFCVFMLNLKLNRKLMTIIWIVAFYGINQIFLELPELKKLNEINICQDAMYCSEYAGGLNEQNCLEKDFSWNVDDKACQYRFELKECYKLEGNWQYPKACEEKILP